MQAHLINKQGCTFDSAKFISVYDARDWALGRGNDCTLMIYTDSFIYTYRVRGNRLELVDYEYNQLGDLDRQYGKE